MRQDAAVTGKPSLMYLPLLLRLAQSRKDRINAERERKGRKRARKQAELDLLLKAHHPEGRDRRGENKEGGPRFFRQFAGESRLRES